MSGKRGEEGMLAAGWAEDIPKPAGEAPAVPDVDMYYDHRGGCYFRRDVDSRYIKTSMMSARRYLKLLGFSSRRQADDLPSPMDKAMEHIETHQNCDYAASLAGFSAGLYRVRGRRILVTESPALIDARKGSWDTLSAVFQGLLGEEQCLYFFAWLKLGIAAVRQNTMRPGQALVIAGPPRCGKSLCQAIITQLLGGRSAKPFAFLCGRTDFNSELFQAEHLMIEDEAASSDPRVRKKFGAEIKGLTANRDQRCHAKNREAMTLQPIWRVSITLNDDPSALLVLPPLEDGLKDKLMIFRASRFQMPVDTSHARGEVILWNQIERELPAFVHYLEKLEIPEPMREARFGVKAWIHPELLELMDAATDEVTLLELIDVHVFGEGDDGEPWEGSAKELEQLLVETYGAGSTRRLMPFNNSCGQLMGVLKLKRPDRVSSRTLHGKTLWKVQAPVLS